MRPDELLHDTTTAPLTLAVVMRALRVEQWVKNLLVFMPLMMAPEVVDVSRYDDALLAFLAFSFCASAAYVLNDLSDLDADRIHPTKRSRPLAAGELSPAAGVGLALACVGLGLACASLLPWLFGVVLVLYVAATTLYSYRLKHIPLVDVIVLALLYVGRVIAGGAATQVPPSPWLLGFSLFFFLSLAFVKRFAELRAANAHTPELSVRGYLGSDLDLITINGTVSGYLSVLVAALYINGDRAPGVYEYPVALWLICPLLLFWISRMWMLAHRGQLKEDPVFFAIRDRTSWVVYGLIVAVLLIARV